MIDQKRFFAALGLSLLFVAPSAFAGAGVITTSVVPVTNQVTYAAAATATTQPLVTVIGYKVNVGSALTNTNTTNNVRFTASISVADPQEKAIYSSSEGRFCYTTANPVTGINDETSIECPIGQLRAGEQVPEFYVFFKAPRKDATEPITPDGTIVPGSGGAYTCSGDCVAFSGRTYYAEGTGGVPNSPVINSYTDWLSGAVALGTCNPTEIKSALQKSGGTFFTGDSFSCAADPFKVELTAAAFTNVQYSIVHLLEKKITNTSAACTANANFIDCFQADVTVENVKYQSTSGSYLSVFLRILGSNVQPGTKIGDVVITYNDGINSHTINRFCPTPTTPYYDGIPCIGEQFTYKKSEGGGFGWRLLNDKNGFFTLE